MRSLKISVFTCLIIIASGLFGAEPVIEQQLVGTLTFIFSPRGNANLASPFDEIVLNVTIPFSIAKTGGRNQLRSAFQWAGKTKRGASVDWQLSGPGEAVVDWNAVPPKLSFDLSFIFNINGVRFPVHGLFTTERGSDAFGPTSGSARKLSDTSAELVIAASSINTVNLKILGLEDRQEELQSRATFNGKLIGVNGSKLF